MKTRLTLLAACLGLLAYTASPPGRLVTSNGAPLLLRPEFVKVFAAGLRELAADYYWVLTTQQIGLAQTSDEYRAIADYANQAVALDPRFLLVYRFAASALPYPEGREEWRHGDLAESFLRRALVQAPGHFQTRLMLANNLFVYQKKYAAAGRLLQELSQEPGAPPHLALLATRLLAQSGDTQSAWEFARILRDAAQDQELRQHYEQRMHQLEQEFVLQSVDRAARAFAAREGHNPSSVAELVERGDLPSKPVDPLGGEVFLDAAGVARATSAWYRLEIYTKEGKDAARRALGDQDTFSPPHSP